jgi:hypothetical protein
MRLKLESSISNDDVTVYVTECWWRTYVPITDEAYYSHNSELPLWFIDPYRGLGKDMQSLFPIKKDFVTPGAIPSRRDVWGQLMAQWIGKNVDEVA